MCLIAYARDKHLIKPETLGAAYDNNPNGWGIVFAQGGKLYICRRLDNFETFLEVFKEVPDKVPVAVHFRFRTQGDISIPNTHPFELAYSEEGDPCDVAFMHNGTISQVDQYKKQIKVSEHYSRADTDDVRSDTAIYADVVLRPIISKNPDLAFSPHFMTLLKRDIGTHNKLLFMDGNGRVMILNKSEGHVDEKNYPGVWFSNEYSLRDSWRSSKKTHTYGYPTTSTPSESNSTSSTGGSSHSASNTNSIDKNYEIDSDLPEELKKLLKPGEKLRKRFHRPEGLKDDSNMLGFGWVRKQDYTLKFDPIIGKAQKDWYVKLVEEKEKNKVVELKPQVNTNSSGSSVTVNGNKVDVVTLPNEDLIVKALEEQFDTKQFRQMNRSEVVAWVIDYPEQAAIWLQKNKWYGSKDAIDTFLQTNYELAAEYIHDYSHGRYGPIELDRKIPKEFKDDPDLDNMYGLGMYG